MTLIDSHCHIDGEQFDEDRDEVPDGRLAVPYDGFEFGPPQRRLQFPAVRRVQARLMDRDGLPTCVGFGDPAHVVAGVVGIAHGIETSPQFIADGTSTTPEVGRRLDGVGHPFQVPPRCG